MMKVNTVLKRMLIYAACMIVANKLGTISVAAATTGSNTKTYDDLQDDTTPYKMDNISQQHHLRSYTANTISEVNDCPHCNHYKYTRGALDATKKSNGKGKGNGKGSKSGKGKKSNSPGKGKGKNGNSAGKLYHFPYLYFVSHPSIVIHY